jgi:acetyl esterase/lipase
MAIATNRIGVMGFSAGGEVAFLSAQRSAPVPGVATRDGLPASGISKVSASSSIAAPEDGRTPDAASNTIDTLPVLPAFQALIYPGRLQRIEPATNSPPVFLVCGYNDRADISEGLASVYLKFKQLKVPAELHIYAGSGHGFGLRANDPKPAAKWIERFEEWLVDSGFLKMD